MDEILNFRGQLGGLFFYDWIPLPLVYTQVSTICVYSYFILALMGHQFIQSTGSSLPNQTVDFVVPVFTFFQFLFYVVCNRVLFWNIRYLNYSKYE